MTIKILVIEDDEAIRQAIVFKFHKEGIQVVEAEEGLTGFYKLKNEGPFSMVLLDLRMPKSDGFAFLEQKKEEPMLKDVPVFVVTNLTEKEYKDKARSLGVKGYMVKAQHSIQEIVDQVKKCLTGDSCIFDA